MSDQNLFNLVLLIVLVAALPVVGVWDFRRLRRRVREGHENARIDTYFWAMGISWALTIGFTAWWLISGGSLHALRLIPAVSGLQWLAVATGVAALILVYVQMAIVVRSPERLGQVRGEIGGLLDLAPRSSTERTSFVLLSVTAGICEEILYRGLLLAILAEPLGTWPAVLLSSAIFGLGHAYQGTGGIAKTALTGAAMALLAVGTGSLFLPMLLHAVIDLTSGAMLAKASDEESWNPAPETA